MDAVDVEEEAFPDAHQAALPDGGKHLLIGQRRRGFVQAEAFAACGNSAGGAQDHVAACLVQRRALAHQFDHVRPV